jgi:hypothetical protein
MDQPDLFSMNINRNRVASAEFSECEEHREVCRIGHCVGRKYRYLLKWPTGLDNDRVALLIAANPSTANADELDPTLTRWRNYCKVWGYGWAWTANVRAWRATNPKDVPPDPLAIGPMNESWLSAAFDAAELVICGWGKLGGSQGIRVARWAEERVPVKPLMALKLNKDGSPCHPLYLRADATPIPYETTTAPDGTISNRCVSDKRRERWERNRETKR